MLYGVGNGSACTMHVVRVSSNMHVGSACNMHVMCMLYECWRSMLVEHVTCMLYEGCNTIGAHLTSQYVGKGHHCSFTNRPNVS